MQKSVRESCKIQTINFGIFTISRDITVCMRRRYHVQFCVLWVWYGDVAILDIEKETPVHTGVPNSAEHTEVDYRAPPRCECLCYNLCMLIIHVSSDLHSPNANTLMVYPHNLSSNNHNLATRRPTPNVDQADATGSVHGSPMAMVVPPKHATLTKQGNSPKAIALWFLQCWQNKF